MQVSKSRKYRSSGIYMSYIQSLIFLFKLSKKALFEADVIICSNPFIGYPALLDETMD